MVLKIDFLVIQKEGMVSKKSVCETNSGRSKLNDGPLYGHPAYQTVFWVPTLTPCRPQLMA
jgi:hypothetical protein